MITYEYSKILQYCWSIKAEIKNFREKYPESIVALKMVNNLMRVVENKTRVSHCSDITSILIKAMMTFYW